jgi:DNA-binding PadR family transcriptional regulator
MIDLKAKPKPVKEMYGDIRSKSKIFRLTELQLEQLEQHLEKEQTTFTDFILSLIQREL